MLINKYRRRIFSKFYCWQAAASAVNPTKHRQILELVLRALVPQPQPQLRHNKLFTMTSFDWIELDLKDGEKQLQIVNYLI